MRLAFFSDTYLPQINGVSRTLGRLKKHLENRGIPHRLFVPAPSGTEKEDVINFRSSSFPLYPECKIALPQYFRIKEELDDFRPDLIHVLTPFSLGLAGRKYALKNSIPLVASYHTDFPSYLQHYGLPFLSLEKGLWSYLRWFHKKSRINFCPSESTRKELQNKGFSHLEIWGRGICTETFSPDFKSPVTAEKHGLEGKDIILLYVGRLAREKEIGVLLDAVRTLQKKNISLRLLLVGDGPERKKIVASAPPEVVCTGYQTGKELSRLYAEADIFAFPSSTETFGNVILEAMASGVPVVAPRGGGVRENIVHNENGRFFAAGDAEDMARSLEILIRNESLRQELGKKAREFTLQKSWEAVLNRLLSRYTDIIAPKRQVSA